MKKILLIVVSCILILSLVSCSKDETPKASETPKIKIDSPIVGTWKYYKDVPDVPSQKTWTLFFNKDGTYTTEGDTIKYKSDKAKNSTESSHADTWGAKGTYSVTENRLTLTWDYKGKTERFSSDFEIKEENGGNQLIFKDDSGEVSVATIGEGKTIYYTIFIKQK